MIENKKIEINWDEVYQGLVIQDKKEGIKPALQLGEQPKTKNIIYPQSREFENGADSPFFFSTLSNVLARSCNKNIEISLGDDEPINVDGWSIIEISVMITVAEAEDQ